MKHSITKLIIALLLFCLTACSNTTERVQIAATTKPVYEFTSRICENTGLTVTQLITETVSCLHDYTMQTKQMKAAESAELIVISGVELEDFLDFAITDQKAIIDSSLNVPLIHCDESETLHQDEHQHHHEADPHIWLSPKNAKIMAQNIYEGLAKAYPSFKEQFHQNLIGLHAELDEIITYGEAQLADLTCSDLVTFHDGFAYLAAEFDLRILHAIEEESGSEASAQELIHIIDIIKENKIPSIFTETNGSVSAAKIISSECDIAIHSLDMCMGTRNYFEAMYYNIDSLKEALE